MRPADGSRLSLASRLQAWQARPCVLISIFPNPLPAAKTCSAGAAPRIAFVSLGCPKALVDSEQIISRLSAEGYELTKSYAGAAAVIVNTCGFLDSAKAESLAAIGAARLKTARSSSPAAWARSPRRSRPDFRTSSPSPVRRLSKCVVQAVHEAVAPPHDPFLDLLPPQGVKLTPRHYAYLKISEGCNNRCSFCIIPKLRGDLVSRPAADVLREAEKLVAAGVKELLVISQDTSAYGLDLRYSESLFHERAVQGKIHRSRPRTRRARRLGPSPLRLSVSACGRSHRTDGGAAHFALSRHSVPACKPQRLAGDEAARRSGENAGADQTLARRLSRPHHPLDIHCRLSRRNGSRFRLPPRLARRREARPGRRLQI